MDGDDGTSVKDELEESVPRLWGAGGAGLEGVKDVAVNGWNDIALRLSDAKDGTVVVEF